MKMVLFLFILLVIVVVGGKYAIDYVGKNGLNLGKQTTVTVNNKVFSVKVAKTEEDRQIGLSKTNSLASSSGMLFIFDTPGLYTFWMKDMKFPIDILFINGNKITDIFENVPIPADASNLQTYVPTEPADKVLELPAGTVSSAQIKKGDSVTIKNL